MFPKDSRNIAAQLYSNSVNGSVNYHDIFSFTKKYNPIKEE